MSQRDLVHVLEALWRLSGGEPQVAVAVGDIDAAIGRGNGDMRTPLNLQSLREQSFAVELSDDAWALTAQGIARLALDRDLSGSS